MRSLVLALLLGTALPAAAQQPYLVRDLNTGPRMPSSSHITAVVNFGERIFFINSPISVLSGEPWITDGTPAGTRQLANIGKGSGARISMMFRAGNTLFFSATDEEHGHELWATDGTPEGTRLVKDMSPGRTSSAFSGPTLFNGRFYFIAQAGGMGSELWTSDGTEAGTHALDVTPGPASSGTIIAGVLNGRLYYAGEGLFSTDGTFAGTQRHLTTPISSAAVVKDRIVFVPSGSEREPWVTDGTPEGTKLLKDIKPGPSPSLDTPHILHRPTGDTNSLMFFADDGVHGFEPWITDGTTEGTRLLKDIQPGASGSKSDAVQFHIGNVLYFGAADAAGLELWRTDGTEGGTRMVKDIRPGPAGSEIRPYARASNDTRGFFAANDGVHGRELWVTDGTDAGTRLVKDIEPGAGSGIEQITGADLGGKLVFPAKDAHYGSELWISDGTAEGTKLFVNVTEDAEASSNPTQLAAIGDRVSFTASSDRSVPPSGWISDGTADGTRAALAVGAQPVLYRGAVYFIDGARVMRADADLQAATVLAQGLGEITNLGTLGDWLTFMAGGRLWLSGGTPQVTRAAIPDDPSGIGTRPVDFFGHPLYRSGGKILIADLGPTRARALATNLGSASEALHRVGGKVLFFGGSGSLRELWATDGSAEGTGLVKSFASSVPGTGGAVAGTKLFFSEFSNEAGYELWVSDGTAAGTRMVKDIAPGAEGSGISEFAVLGDSVVFPATGAGVGRELWISDGTESGTRMIRDIRLGAASSSPATLRSADGRVFFTADDGITGRELWQTDGTEGGTVRLGDIETGARGSDPQELTVAGDRLFFTALTFANGRELWAYPLSGRPSLSVENARVKESARSASFTVRLSRASAETVTVDYAIDGGAAGTLTFAPGETAKTIPVSFADDATIERNDAMHLRLRDPRGATLAATAGTILIVDDDTMVDLAITHGAEVSGSGFYDVYTITNRGAGTAREVRFTHSARALSRQPVEPFSLAPGESRTISVIVSGAEPNVVYKHFAHVESDERDVDGSNDAITTYFVRATSNELALSAPSLQLHRGSRVDVTIMNVRNIPGGSLTSSAPGVVSVPAIVPFTNGRGVVTFEAKQEGQAEILVSAQETLRITVKVEPPAPQRRRGVSCVTCG